MYGIRGEVEFRLMKPERGVTELLTKMEKGLPLNTEEKDFRDRITTKKVIRHNLIMDRMIDRFAGMVGHSNSVFYEAVVPLMTPTYDVNMWQKQYGKHTYRCDIDSLIWSNHRFAFHPELIGLGDDNTPATTSDRGLYSPFLDSYRNCYTSREGGTNSATRDNYLFRCGTRYGTTYVPAADIEEAGLFFNKLYPSLVYWVQSAGPIPPAGAWFIDMTRLANLNQAWDICNVTEIHYYTVLTVIHRVMKTYRRDDTADVNGVTFSWQPPYIVYNGADGTGFVPDLRPTAYIPGGAGVPNEGAFALVSFTPRYDHLRDGAMGSDTDFLPPGDNSDTTNIPQLYARVVLPEPITKTINEYLYVCWMIYLEEYEP